MNNELPPHWLYAFGHAMSALDRLVCQFSFSSEVRHHTYVGVPAPGEVIEIIDGFLAEEVTTKFGGNRTRLLELRDIVLKRIAPAFELGIVAAREVWHQQHHTIGDTPTPVLHDQARRRAPSGRIEREWFIEGYSQSWAVQEIDSVRLDDDRGN